jgi:electron transport complex protein RnfB
MIEVCTAFGDIAGWLADAGKAKAASKKDVLEVKAAAEKEGLVTWMFNVTSDTRYNGSCSCCGCRCGALRSVTEFNAPGMIAPPHFMPRFDQAACVYCEKCVNICPMRALTIVGEGDGRRLLHESARCIGCGLCAVACKKSAVVLHEMPGYKEPKDGWPRFWLKNLPNQITNIRAVSARRKGR